ncbi:hypothetical protein OKA04_07090 [Luteolibacter flavescens]|uniref:Uncharacterized protein n=1 Tax=Luteolibacter flavescens TaxID=1859460 RepID=A0ABT3FLP7_9BACT|nr:hypothetical protein [Luteolibacter flavescens]MCW1884491.1 hypothetical protein [Luteolibacter flavescens]
MKNAEYKRSRLITTERLLASVLVLIWVGLAFWLGGHVLAIRASLTFMVPLGMIWLPQLLARVDPRENRWGGDFTAPPSALGLRIVAWFVIVGVPLS